MIPENEEIKLSGASAMSALVEIEFMLISLKNIARHYYDNVENLIDIDPLAYALETTRFIDEHDFVYKLANIRELISSSFDDRPGPDDLDDIERELEKLKFWEKPGD